MDGKAQFFQRREQTVQRVGQRNGTGGIGQKERAHDQEDHAQNHKPGGIGALHRDMPQNRQVAHRRAAGKKQVHHRCEQHDDIHRAQPPAHGAKRHAAQKNAHAQHQRHQAVAHEPFGAKKRHDIQHHAQDLGAGIQAVYRRVTGEILPQRDILQHTPPPFKARICRRSSSTV